jgi:hypothetical protein
MKIRRWSGRTRTYIEMEIEWSYKGYEDPGVCSGPPERCYPPEGEDERTIEDVKINGVSLPRQVRTVLDEILQPLIEGEELPDET